MFRKRAANEAVGTNREPLPANESQIEDLGLVVSAAWHGFKQRRHFLPSGFRHTIEDNVVSMMLAKGEGTAIGNFDEVRIILSDGPGTLWTIQTVRAIPNVVDEIPQGFLRRTTTYPLVVGGEVTTEAVVCKPDDKSVLQPISEPTIGNDGPITDVQVENLYQSLIGLGAMGNNAT